MKRLVPLLFVCSVLLVCLCGCKLDGDDPDDFDDGGDSDSSSFSWVSPDLPEESIFTMGNMENEESRSVSRWVASGGDSTNERLEPDGFYAAYRYIGLIPETTVAEIADIGFQAYCRGDGVVQADTLENIDTSKIPGYYVNAQPGNPPTWTDGSPVFEAYVDDTTAITRDSIKDASFPMYDSADNGGDLMVFDITEGTNHITIEDLPEDLDVVYTGVASELVYFQVDIDEYGSLRFYFNDDPPYYAGDVTVDTGTGWKWAYFKHGDGLDADCFTNTSNDPAYDTVNAPDDPENPSGSWSNGQTYVGRIDVGDVDNANESSYDSSFSDLYTYMFDFDQNNWGNGFINGDKRPEGSGSYSYLMVSNEIMNTGYGSNLTQYLYPHLNLDEVGDIGGFADYLNDGDPGTNTAFKDRSADSDAVSYISGYDDQSGDGEVENWELEPRNAFVVYHEADSHASADDLTRIVYLEERLDYIGENKDGIANNDLLLSREELRKTYGWYGWDSGLYSTLYDDGDIMFYDSDNYGIILNPLYFALGRMHTYAYNPPADNPTDPEYTDSWYDRVISMKIELQLDACIQYGTDALSDPFGAGGAAIASDEFERRFLTLVPDWISAPPSDPVPRPYDFNGNGDVIELPLKFMILPENFSIRHEYVHYVDVHTLPVQIYPDPSDGPFTSDIEISFSLQNNVNDQKIFYTTDGSEPVVNGDLSDIRTLTAGAGTHLYENPLTIDQQGEPVTLAVVGYERKTNDTGEYGAKERSITREAVFSFKHSGTTLSCTITNSTLPENTPLFAGLFSTQTVDLSSELNPRYWGSGILEGGTAAITIEDVEDGTYYLCILADADGNEQMSDGDQIFPAQTGTPRDSHELTGLVQIHAPRSTPVTAGNADWTVY